MCKKGSVIFISELAYSLHLGSDKNKKIVSRKTAKTNKSGTTSLTKCITFN